MRLASHFARMWVTLGFVLAAPVPTAQVSSLLPQSVKVPPVHEAMQVSIAKVDKGIITLDVLPLPGVYLYRDKFKVSAAKSPALKLGALRFPAVEMVDDETFGKVAVFRGPQQIQIPYSGDAKSTLTVDMMGCHAEAKICYPPHRVKLTIDTTGAGVRATAPISPASSPRTTQSPRSPKPGADGVAVVVRSERELDQALKQARNRYALVDVWATWCTPCKQMEKTTFADTDVQRLMQQEFVLIKVDVTQPGAQSNALLKRFGLAGPPGFAFYGKSGKEIGNARLMGYIPPEKFLAHLKLVIS